MKINHYEIIISFVYMKFKKLKVEMTKLQSLRAKVSKWKTELTKGFTQLIETTKKFYNGWRRTCHVNLLGKYKNK